VLPATTAKLSLGQHSRDGITNLAGQLFQIDQRPRIR
jgi:hypothetical protein